MNFNWRRGIGDIGNKGLEGLVNGLLFGLSFGSCMEIFFYINIFMSYSIIRVICFLSF